MQMRLAALVLAALGGSQAGHVVSYQARFGAAASTIQSHGTHAYFQPVAGTFLGVTGALLLASLLLIGFARLVAGKRLGFKPKDRWSFTQVLPLLFALQLAIYIAQESLESAIGGTPAPLAVELLLWGALGQLPVALLATLAVTWISVRLDVALEALRETGAAARLAHERPATELLLIPVAVPTAMLLGRCSPASFAKRGPPRSF